MNLENISTGIDIEDIERFKNRDDAFIKRIYSQGEIDYCQSMAKPEQHFAARFCAKEAIFKALSAFNETSIEYNKIEIYHENKVPQIRFLSNLQEKYQAKVSLTHDKTKAMAYVIIQKKELTEN